MSIRMQKPRKNDTKPNILLPTLVKFDDNFQEWSLSFSLKQIIFILCNCPGVVKSAEECFSLLLSRIASLNRI